MDFNIMVPRLFMAFGALIVGLMFLEGRFHGENTKLTYILDIDKLLFPDLNNKVLIKSSDCIGFIICTVSSTIIFIIGLGASVGLLDAKVTLGISSLLLLGGILGAWVIKFIFVFIYRNTPEENTPVIWPQKRKDSRY